eukprot:scaffold172026_cov41-Tisochrysis_lutea.AAC.1
MDTLVSLTYGSAARASGVASALIASCGDDESASAHSAQAMAERTAGPASSIARPSFAQQQAERGAGNSQFIQ